VRSSGLHDAFSELDRLPLPPEDQWLPAPRARMSATRSFILVVLVVLATVGAIVLLRAVREPLDRVVVPAGQPSATAEDRAAVPTPSATPAQRPPQAPGVLPPGLLATGTHQVTGVVYESVGGARRPLADVPVDIHVFTPKGGYSLWYVLGHPIVTDANGRFVATDLGDVVLVLYSVKPGYVQPTATTVTVRSDTVIDIELVTQAAVTSSPSPGDGPAVSGIVYEVTGDGRRPIPGARVSLEWQPDVVTATTITDANGRYRLARIPTGPVGVYAQLPAHLLADVAATVTVTTVDLVLDLEIKRAP